MHYGYIDRRSFIKKSISVVTEICEISHDVLRAWSQPLERHTDSLNRDMTCLLLIQHALTDGAFLRSYG
jgi:hypothetical protein